MKKLWSLLAAMLLVVGASAQKYTELEYIECTGGNRANAYTTDYIPNSNTIVKTAFQQVGRDGWMGIFCARNQWAGSGISLYVNGDNAHLGYFVGDAHGENDNFLDYEEGADYEVEAHTSYLKYSVNGGGWNEKATGKTEMVPTTRCLSFFANPEWDQAFKGKIYYFGIDDGTVSYDYRPAMRHDGVYGFYDAASGKFVTPALNSYSNYKYGVLPGNPIVTISQNSVNMKEGETVTINVDGATNLTWKSDDEVVATVENGVIKGKVDGDCVVTCSTEELGGWEFKINVAVRGNINYSVWNGTDDAILPAVKYSGEAGKWAYTWVADSHNGYVEADYNRIWGVPEADGDNNAWYAAEYDLETTESVWTWSNNVIPNSWPDTMSDVYAIRYFKAKGSLEGKTVYLANPYDDSPCEWYLNGELLWKNTDGWNEDQIVRLSEAQKALIKTDGSINVLAFHVHQNWGGRYADGGLYIGGAPVNNFKNEVNYKCLQSAIAQLEEEGKTYPEIEEAKTGTLVRSQMEDSLNKLRYAKFLEEGNNNITLEGVAPADGLECWIYNVGAGQFLAGGNAYGTHASLISLIPSQPMVLHAAGENFTIQTNLPNGKRGNNDWLGHNGYVDTGSKNDAWTFEAVGDGSYRIINIQNEGENIYLGMSEDVRFQVDSDKKGADNKFNHWKIFTKAQFEALAEAATTKKPADVSYMIHQNSFSQHDFEGEEGNDNLAWKWGGNTGAGAFGRNDADGQYTFEMWNTTGDTYLTQTVEGLRPGKYIVSCNGLYRDGSWEDAAIDDNRRQLAYLYAGTRENAVLLPSILDYADKGVGYGRYNANASGLIPDGCNISARFFNLGNYKVEVPVMVGEDGKLELGIFRNGAEAKDDWVVVDNFRLQYLGGLPKDMNIRYNNNWGGVKMEEVATGDEDAKHFRYEGWLSTNRDEGIFINFKDDKGNFWCPQQINKEDEWVKLHIIAPGVETADLANTKEKEYAGFAVTAPTNMISVDVYVNRDGTRKVVFENTAPQHAGDAIYITAEKYGWSREPDAAHTIDKVEDGVYEGVVTITRDDVTFDQVRLYTKPYNGDNDDYIGFNNEGRQKTYAANGVTYNLSYRPDGNFRMRHGDTKVRVDLNEGEVTFEYLGEKSYVYAVGDVVNGESDPWNLEAKDIKLWETEAGSLLYQGVVEIMEGRPGEFSLFEERTANDWEAGRWGPNSYEKQPVAAEGEWYNGLGRWGDRGWKNIPAGKWLMTLDVVNDRFMYELAPEVVYTAKGVVGDPYMMGRENLIAFYNTPVEVEVWNKNYMIIKGWNGKEGNDLKVSYDDELEITGVTPIIDGEEQPVEVAEGEDEIHDMFIFDTNSKYGECVVVAEESTLEMYENTGAMMLFMVHGEMFDEEMAYSIYWPGKPIYDVNVTFVQSETAGAYATYYNSEDNMKLPEGVSAYTYAYADGNLKATELDTWVVPAGVAVVLYADEAGDYTLTSMPGDFSEYADEWNAASDLKGTDEAEEVTAADGKALYKLAKGSKGVGFYLVSEDGKSFTNGAHKAYLEVSADAAAKFFGLGDTGTGIDAAENNESRSEIFTVSGVKIEKATQKGLYIVNGKKHVVK